MSKKAVLFGLNYYNDASSALSGCINDAKNIQGLLKEHLGYTDEDILLCTDETTVKPTRSNMIRVLNELVMLTHRERIDQIFVSYSGHGTTLSGDSEIDGADEALVPLDFRQEGVIRDDELGAIIRKVHTRTDCILLIDACHSGSALDFPYRYISGNKYAIENDTTVPCRAIMISGCQDDQTAQETWSFNDDKKITGLMTSSFLYALQKNNYDVTCFKLIKYMQDYMSSIGATQRPQLTTTRQLSQTCVFMTRDENARSFFVHAE